MTILVSGGGSGGHITPILAVAHELKLLQPDCRVVYVGERGGKFQSLTEGQSDIDEVHSIFAGKFRRYHGESWLKRIIDVYTNLKNLRDALYVGLGYLQSFRLLGKVKPDVVFLKGGYVGLPIGLASATRHIAFVTHDSDALPGLTNRLVARWAAVHATGMPAEYYTYPAESQRYTGVLVGEQFKLVDDDLKLKYRKELKLPVDSVVLVVTGGSLGAERLNAAFGQIVEELLLKYPKLVVIHQVGKGKTGLYEKLDYGDRLVELEFMQGMERYTGSADVVITRAGANTLAELGVQGKACVVVPNPLLTAGHQLKNAEYLVSHQAVLAVGEDTFSNDNSALLSAIEELLNQPAKREELGTKLHSLTKPQAAKELAQILIDAADRN